MTTDTTGEDQGKAAPPNAGAARGWTAHETGEFARSWRKGRLEISYARFGYAAGGQGSLRDSKTPYAIKRDARGDHELSGVGRRARVRTFPTFEKAEAALSALVLEANLEAYVMARNGVRSARAAAGADYSGARVSSLREAERACANALERIADWVEDQAREKIARR